MPRRFAAVKDYIAAGDIYQANLSFRARFAFAGDPLALYEQLRAAQRRGALRLSSMTASGRFSACRRNCFSIWRRMAGSRRGR